MVYCVGGHGEHGAGREMVRGECDPRAGGDDAREAERGGAVHAEGFGYCGVEAEDVSRVFFVERGGRV